MSWTVAALAALLLWSIAGQRVLSAFHEHGSPSARVMLTLWTLTTTTWLLTCVVMLTTLATQAMGPGVKAFIAACVSLIQAAHNNGAQGVLFTVALLAVAGITRLTWTALRRRRARTNWVRNHLRWLTHSARHRTVHQNRVWLLDSPEPLAYCLPGRDRKIVLSRGSIEQLSAKELRAVLAHERAHLDGRHHLIVAWARLLDRAFPGIPLLRVAALDVPELVEWAADDRAALETGSHALAHALGVMATAKTHGSEPSLAMSGACPVRRVRRQVHAAGPESGAVVNIGAVLLILLPLTLAAVATVLNVALPYCECLM